MFTYLATTLFGAALGFAVSVLTFYFQRRVQRRDDMKRESAERQRIRTLVRLEKTHNVQVLIDLWDAATTQEALPAGVLVDTEEREFLARRRLAELPLAPWSRTVWERIAPNAPGALDDEEIASFFTLYARLGAFEIARARIQRELSTGTGPDLSKTFDRWQNSKRANGGRARTKDEEDTVLGRLREFNQFTFTDFHGNQTQLGCERIVGELRNPITDTPALSEAPRV